jgi:hypothetical protein
MIGTRCLVAISIRRLSKKCALILTRLPLQIPKAPDQPGFPASIRPGLQKTFSDLTTLRMSSLIAPFPYLKFLFYFLKKCRIDVIVAGSEFGVGSRTG